MKQFYSHSILIAVAEESEVPVISFLQDLEIQFDPTLPRYLLIKNLHVN